MNDTIIFMSTYDATTSKSKKLKKSNNITSLLSKHRIDYIISDDKLISKKGVILLERDYDYVHQSTAYTFKLANQKQNIDDFKEIIDSATNYIGLMHANTVLGDSSYITINLFLCLESFLVYIDDKIYQVDPIVFTVNSYINISFELINYNSGEPIHVNDICGKSSNYNIVIIKGYQYLDEKSTTLSNSKISDLIINNVINFYNNLLGKSPVTYNYSFIHNILILSNDIIDIKKTICDVIGTIELPAPLSNISTTNLYEYYPQDGASILTKYNDEDKRSIMLNGIVLESIKMYIYLSQIINSEITKSVNDVIQNNLFIDNLFYSPRFPIETYNLLEYIHKTKSYQFHQKSTELKISYMTMQNEIRKNRNATLLNFLLYMLSLVGAIGTLEPLEEKLGIPFKYSFCVVLFSFILLGIIWLVIEFQHSRH